MKVTSNVSDKSHINGPLVRGDKKISAEKYLKQIAHDIRGPLSALDSLIRFCQDKLEAEESEIMLTILDRLHGIADNILTKPSEITLDANKIPKKIPDKEFLSIVKNIIEEKKIQYREKYDVIIKDVLLGTSIKYSSSYDALVNPVEFQRILSNITNNAVEAVGDRGEVLIALKREKDHLVLAVDDDGIGISPDILPKLMQEGATFNKKGGNGYGLFHAKKTLNLWGGDISIEPKKDNTGTLVKLFIPIETTDRTQGSSTTALL